MLRTVAYEGFRIVVSALGVRFVNAILNAFELFPEKWIITSLGRVPTEAWLEISRWGIALVLGVVIILFWGWLRRPKAPAIVKRLESKVVSPPAIAKTAPQDVPTRTFTHLTARQLIAIFETPGLSRLQASKLVEPYFGLWLETDTHVVNVLADSLPDHTYGYFKDAGDANIECRFGPQWIGHILALKPDESVRILGKIVRVTNTDVFLRDCEIVSGPKQAVRKEPATLRKPTVVAPAVAPELPRLLTPYEIGRKLELIDQLIKLVDTFEKPIYEGSTLYRHWHDQLADGTQAYIGKLREVQTQLSERQRALHELLNNNRQHDDIALLVGINYENPRHAHRDFFSDGNNFIQALEKIGKPPYQVDIIFFVEPAAQRFDRAMQDLRTWKSTSARDLLAQRKKLAQ